MKIEFEIKQIDTRIGKLISAFEGSDCKGIANTFILSGESEDPDSWLQEDRKKAFEENLNTSELSKDGMEFKLLSVRKVY